jgi:hypothetical protein
MATYRSVPNVSNVTGNNLEISFADYLWRPIGNTRVEIAKKGGKSHGGSVGGLAEKGGVGLGLERRKAPGRT